MKFNFASFDQTTAQYLAYQFAGGETLQQVAQRLIQNPASARTDFYMSHGEDGANVTDANFAASLQRLGLIESTPA